MMRCPLHYWGNIAVSNRILTLEVIEVTALLLNDISHLADMLCIFHTYPWRLQRKLTLKPHTPRSIRRTAVSC